jgi:flagellar capping protein FliD
MSTESEQLRDLAKQLLKTCETIKAESDRLMKKAEELDTAIKKNNKQKSG